MIKYSSIFIKTAMFCFIFIPSFAETKTIVIPSNSYKTIQSGINAANTGDTIRIRAGIYHESLVILKSGIILEGENKANSIIIPQKNTHTTILIIDSSDCTIRNLTIDGKNLSFNRCYGLSFGIRKIGKQIYISKIYNKKIAPYNKLQPGMQIVSVNGKPADYIFIAGLSSNIFELKLHDKTKMIRFQLRSFIHPIYGKFTYRPNGIMIVNSTVKIKDCNIKNLGGDGIVVIGSNSYAHILNNRIENNVYGIWFCWSSKGVAYNNTCIHNRGAGISITDEETYPMIKHNRCTLNHISGIYIGNFADGVVEGNDCRANKRYSIYAYQAGENLKLSKNILK